MKIANIIHEKELVNHTKVEYINYISKPTEYDSLDKTLPTLYVGWSFMKVSNPENELIQNADILKKKIISNELYWEFNFDESKASHIKGVDKFVNIAPRFYFESKYSYINLDPVFFNIRDVEDLMDVIAKEIDFLYNYKNEMIYLLVDNKIIGINLIMFSFFKFNILEILSKLQERTTNYQNDLEGEIYKSHYKILPNFPQLKRYLIVILSK